MKEREKTKKKLMNKLFDLRKMLDELPEAISEFQKSEDKIQEKIIEYEKLSALGRLTANVAHEIRNPITVIGGLTKRLQKGLCYGSEENEYLELISAEAKKLDEILKDVLVFSDKAVFKREMQNVHKIIDDALNGYEDKCKHSLIDVDRNFGDIPRIFVDERQVRFAIGNILSNAIDAMPEGGKLTISTNVDYVVGKNYVTVSVTDTGTGIPEEKLGMIYEPFFTTKTATQETGLGLSITRRIVEGHGGFVKVDSVVGKGSTFTLFFPYRAK